MRREAHSGIASPLAGSPTFAVIRYRLIRCQAWELICITCSQSGRRSYETAFVLVDRSTEMGQRPGTASHGMDADIVVCGGGTAGCVLAGRLADRFPELEIVVIEDGADSHGVAEIDRERIRHITGTN